MLFVKMAGSFPLGVKLINGSMNIVHLALENNMPQLRECCSLHLKDESCIHSRRFRNVQLKEVKFFFPLKLLNCFLFMF